MALQVILATLSDQHSIILKIIIRDKLKWHPLLRNYYKVCNYIQTLGQRRNQK